VATARLDLDPSRPYQLGGGFLVIWLPRGRGRNDRARGLLSTVHVCTNRGCTCSRAIVAALPIDDRLLWVKHERRGIKLTWEGGSERPRAAFHQLTLDFVTGEMIDARGGDVSAELAPFFREPIPAWVLDDLFAEWAASRPLPEPWFERALREWRPGQMLSMMDAYPDARPDTFVRDGKRYIVDFVFCVAPGCTCLQNRFVLLEEDDTAPPVLTWAQIAAAELDEGMGLRKREGAPEHQSLLTAIYLAWRERSGNPGERFAELRARAMERGAELHALWEARNPPRPTPTAAPIRALPIPRHPAPTPAAPPIPAGKQGRNDPCACGSGRKHKRCCGA
jgi:hypothetical protein